MLRSDGMFVKAAASAQGGNCVEATWDAGCARVVVRDSKALEGPDLRFTESEWGAFLTGVKAGEFEVPAL